MGEMESYRGQQKRDARSERWVWSDGGMIWFDKIRRWIVGSQGRKGRQLHAVFWERRAIDGMVRKQSAQWKREYLGPARTELAYVVIPTFHIHKSYIDGGLYRGSCEEFPCLVYRRGGPFCRRLSGGGMFYSGLKHWRGQGRFRCLMPDVWSGSWSNT